MKGSKFTLLRASLVACTLAVAPALLAPASSPADLPPPVPEYEYYSIPEVSAEISGTYNERYTDPEGDVENVNFSFTTKRGFEPTWWASESPPTVRSTFGSSLHEGTVKLDAFGTHETILKDFPEEPVLCEYAPLSAEPTSEGAGGLLELKPHPSEPGHMTVRASYPLSGAFIKGTSETPEFECTGAVATSGEADKDPQFNEATSPLVEAAVNFDSGQAEQTVEVPHDYSFSVGADQVDIKDVVTVKINRLPPPPPPLGTPGPPEQHGPSTPVPPPTKPEEPPRIPEPEVEANPPVVTGGGGSPPKLHTGITAKCPKGGKPCTVTGIVEAELPAPRLTGKASATRKAKLRRVVLGKVSFTLAAGAEKPVLITLSKAGAAFLRSHPGVRAKIAVTVSASGATKVSKTRTAKLRLPAAHKHR
ncbi:MAG TPA: hypothetical protein VN817_00125 [Solirubrobacteraceae bacterium]|nr:hypothetical protein [Solirubrobacteraceae bacterium]